MTMLRCPVCGQRAAVGDVNAYAPRGSLMGRPIVACGACATLLCVRQGAVRARATPVDAAAWQELEQQERSRSIEPAGPTLDVLQTVYRDVAEALNRVAAIPGYRGDLRLGTLHDELMSALLLAHELVRELEAKQRASAEQARPERP